MEKNTIFSKYFRKNAEEVLKTMKKTAPFTAYFESKKLLEALISRVEIMQKRTIIRCFTRIALFI